MNKVISYNELTSTFNLSEFTNKSVYIECFYYIFYEIINKHNSVKITFNINPYSDQESIIENEDNLNPDLDLEKIYASRIKMKNGIIALSTIISFVVIISIVITITLIYKKKKSKRKTD